MNSNEEMPDTQPDLMGEIIRKHHFERIESKMGLVIDGEEDEPMSSIHFFRKYDAMNMAEKQALAMCRGRVLDVGAGAGCHTLVLQDYGLDVVALEKSEGSCEVMRSRDVRNVIQADIMEFDEGSFDTILLLMNGFGIAGTEQGLIDLLGHLKKKLTPGGKIIGDSTDIRYFKEFQPMIDLAKRSQHEVLFEVHTMGKVDRFPWIFPDEFLLEAMAEELGLQFRVVMYTDEYHFLCEFYQ
jgi:SAM-dependent methyltransferase